MSTPTPAPIFFPPIISTLVDHFSSDWCMAILTGVPDALGNSPIDCVVESEVPNPRPPRLVTLFTVPGSGAQGPVLSTRRVVSQIYEGSMYVSGSLAEKVRGLLVDSKYRQIGIKHVKVVGEPAHFPTPGEPFRWQVTTDVTIRATAGPWS